MRFVTTRVSVIVALLLLGVWVVPSAAAQRNAVSAAQREHARKLFLQGEINFAEGKYTAALRDYQRAFALTNLRGFLLNIAHCHARLGNVRDATKHYRFYLQRAPAGDAHRPAVEDALRALTGAKARGPRVAPLAPRTIAAATEPTVREKDEPAAPPVDDAKPQVPPTTLAAQGEPPGLDIRQTPEAPPVKQSTVTWVWPVLGAAVLAAGTTWFLVSRQEDARMEEGSIGTLSR